MSSEHRRTVNFPSKDMLNAVVEFASGRGVTESKAIGQLVAFALSEYGRNAKSEEFIATFDKIYHQAQQNDDVFKVALKSAVLALVSDSEQGKGAPNILKMSVSLHRDIFNFSGDFTIPVKADGFGGYNEYMIRKDIKRILHEEITKKSPVEWLTDISDYRLGWTDKWLILINQIKIEFYCQKLDSGDGVVNVRYKAKDVIVLPFTLNKYTHCNAMHYIDFDSVKYMTFADYAKNGWNRSKYSHLVYIEHSSHAKTGGFFIGALYEKNNITLHDNSLVKNEHEVIDTNYVNPNLDITIKYAQRAFKITNLRPVLKSEI
ncbi:Uncharacterised protein [Serratia fonticola]|uniref:hypothetical protein n=1 Tax=Serratia fonticola TaxID=47917 RepID=UPI0021799F93|nr:hypothetical protein [Serratia fonticola]CAI1185614.1 Uncharacterised protein [Serratia fonticola]